MLSSPLIQNCIPLKEQQQQQSPSHEEPLLDRRQEDEEVVDIDLNDQEVIEAATKIQAGFKGYMARKDVQAIRVCI